MTIKGDTARLCISQLYTRPTGKRVTTRLVIIINRNPTCCTLQEGLLSHLQFQEVITHSVTRCLTCQSSTPSVSVWITTYSFNTIPNRMHHLCGGKKWSCLVCRTRFCKLANKLAPSIVRFWAGHDILIDGPSLCHIKKKTVKCVPVTMGHDIM